MNVQMERHKHSSAELDPNRSEACHEEWIRARAPTQAPGVWKGNFTTILSDFLSGTYGKFWIMAEGMGLTSNLL